MKVCLKCKEEKEFNNYYKHSKMKDGYFSTCILCRALYSKKYHIENAEKRIKSASKWNANNKERLMENVRKYLKKRRSTDPLFKLSHNIRMSIIGSFRKKGYTKKSRSYN